MTRQGILDMNCQQVEADTRIVLKVKHASEQNVQPSIVVICKDTDVLMILLFHTKHNKEFVWMDVRLSRNDIRIYVYVSKLSVR